MLESLVMDLKEAKRIKDIIETEYLEVYISDGSDYEENAYLVDFIFKTDNLAMRNSIARATEKTLERLGWI